MDFFSVSFLRALFFIFSLFLPQVVVVGIAVVVIFLVKYVLVPSPLIMWTSLGFQFNRFGNPFYKLLLRSESWRLMTGRCIKKEKKDEELKWRPIALANHNYFLELIEKSDAMKHFRHALSMPLWKQVCMCFLRILYW